MLQYHIKLLVNALIAIMTILATMAESLKKGIKNSNVDPTTIL